MYPNNIIQAQCTALLSEIISNCPDIMPLLLDRLKKRLQLRHDAHAYARALQQNLNTPETKPDQVSFNKIMEITYQT